MLQKVFLNAISGAFLSGVLFLSASAAADPLQLKTAGDSKAPIQIYLFSSLTCPHCSVFHQKVLPALQENFIQSGKAHLTFVDMPYDAKAMTGAVMARCIEPDLYDPFMTVLHENQSVWAYSNHPRTLLEGYARVLGADMTALTACMGQEEVRIRITEQRNNLSTLYKVTGMPTVVVLKNGDSVKISGTDKDVILEQIQNIINKPK